MNAPIFHAGKSNPVVTAAVETLDRYVERAVKFLAEAGDYNLELPPQEHGRQVLVTGSQNGYWTGVQLFTSAGYDFKAVKEVGAQQAIDTGGATLNEVALISATGSRQVVPLAEYALAKGLKVHLIVCKQDSETSCACRSNPRFTEVVVPMEGARDEAPTINTCTYGRMLQGVTHESPAAIQEQLAKLPRLDVSTARAVTFVFSDSMGAVAEMVDWKLSGEILGRQSGCKAGYLTNLMHGAFVVDAPGELYVAIGLPGKERAAFEQVLAGIPTERKVHVALPPDAGPLMNMMVAYSLVGQLQRGFPAFQEKIMEYGRVSKTWPWLPSVNSTELA